MQRKTWTLSQVSAADVCHYKVLMLSVAPLAQPLELTDVPWSSRVELP